MAYILDLGLPGIAPLLNFEWEDAPDNARYFGLTATNSVDFERLPTTAILKYHRNKNKNGPEQFPDIMGMPGLNAVSERFKDLVESFEPNVHMFHPIILKRPDGTPITPNYYIFSANQHADFILTKVSDVKWHFYDDWPDQERLKETPSIEWSPFVQGLRFNKKSLCISKPIIADWYLYTHHRAFRHGKLFVSDTFYAALKKEKIKYFEAKGFCEELDMPWDEEENFGPALEWLRTHDTDLGRRQEWEAVSKKQGNK